MGCHVGSRKGTCAHKATLRRIVALQIQLMPFFCAALDKEGEGQESWSWHVYASKQQHFFSKDPIRHSEYESRSRQGLYPATKAAGAALVLGHLCRYRETGLMRPQ